MQLVDALLRTVTRSGWLPDRRFPLGVKRHVDVMMGGMDENHNRAPTEPNKHAWKIRAYKTAIPYLAIYAVLLVGSFVGLNIGAAKLAVVVVLAAIVIEGVSWLRRWNR